MDLQTVADLSAAIGLTAAGLVILFTLFLPLVAGTIRR